MCYNPSILMSSKNSSCRFQAVLWEKKAPYQNSLLDPWGNVF